MLDHGHSSLQKCVSSLDSSDVKQTFGAPANRYPWHPHARPDSSDTRAQCCASLSSSSMKGWLSLGKFEKSSRQYVLGCGYEVPSGVRDLLARSSGRPELAEKACKLRFGSPNTRCTSPRITSSGFNCCRLILTVSYPYVQLVGQAAQPLPLGRCERRISSLPRSICICRQSNQRWLRLGNNVIRSTVDCVVWFGGTQIPLCAPSN